MRLKSVIIIICYYGPLPWYFEYFLHSCSHNKSIDFLFVTDNKTFHKALPSNFKWTYKSLHEINKLATLKLGFKTKIHSSYKLCDFKPTYGLLFSNLIDSYDFWGYGDIDIIFGNIRNFITNNVLQNYEIISVRHDFLTGYFQLLQNNLKMKKLFTRSKDYKKVLSDNKHYCFDETCFKHKDFSEGKSYNEINTPIESMMHVVKKLEQNEGLKAYFNFHVLEGLPGEMLWKDGCLYYKEEYEIILYHLIKFKKIYNPKNSFNIIDNTFKITKDEFIT